MSLYDGHDRILVAVDCIIFGFDQGELKLLLIKRDFEPAKDQWSLMGGFMDKDETLDEAADRILKTLTGLDNVYLEQLHTFSGINRDPVERTISATYFALINIHDHDEKLSADHGASWFSFDDFPELIFDHNIMVSMAKERLKYRASYYPVGFELLPEKFTMPQLQALYEAIFEQELDKRNFIRRIEKLDILVKLDEKIRGTGTKKAFLYRFEPEKYREQERTGNKFLIKP